uniref:PDZ domain-containing protein n=1 Tax=Plectus sambesii TaxID=2011161 RepID=A0A914VVX1_9BILA
MFPTRLTRLLMDGMYCSWLICRNSRVEGNKLCVGRGTNTATTQLLADSFDQSPFPSLTTRKLLRGLVKTTCRKNGTMSSAYGHQPGAPMECLSIAVELRKERFVDEHGQEALKVGFKIGGGIDQDPDRAPFKYPDTGIYITQLESNSPAERAGLKQHDKILQVNGYDFTMVTHDKAVKYIKKYPVLQMLVARSDMNATLA